MQVLFCQDPLARQRVDPDFEREREAAEAAGLAWSLLDFEALIGGDIDRAIRRIAPAETIIYRGWMLRAEQYAALHAALATREALLINDAAAYRATHWLPESLAAIADHTPRTTFTRDLSPEAIARCLEPFGDGAVIVKDFVKSRKHEWDEACFIPRASDGPAAARVISRLQELQGDDFTEGLVFREFVALESAGRHPQSNMPLSRESRIFVLDGRPLMRFDYWEGRAENEPLPAPLRAAVARVPSRFFTVDIARRADDGSWIIMELGDGQVAGLPDNADVGEFYRSLAASLSRASGPDVAGPAPE